MLLAKMDRTGDTSPLLCLPLLHRGGGCRRDTLPLKEEKVMRSYHPSSPPLGVRGGEFAPFLGEGEVVRSYPPEGGEDIRRPGEVVVNYSPALVKTYPHPGRGSGEDSPKSPPGRGVGEDTSPEGARGQMVRSCPPHR